MPRPNPNQLPLPQAEQGIVDTEAALSAVRNMALQWMERDWQHKSHRNMVISVKALAHTDASLDTHPEVIKHASVSERAEQKADDYTITAESDVARAIGVSASIQPDRARGTIKKRVIADDPEKQPQLDEAIQGAWARYGGEDGAQRREDVFNGTAPIDFSGPRRKVEPKASQASVQASSLDPDKLLYGDTRTKRVLTPGALLGAQFLLRGMTIASALNVKESAKEQGIRRDPNLIRPPALGRTEHQALLDKHSLEKLEEMEEEELLKASKYAEDLRKAGLLPAVITADKPERFLNQVQAEFNLANTPEREKVVKFLRKVITQAMTPDKAPPSKPKSKPKRSHARRVSAGQDAHDLDNS